MLSCLALGKVFNLFEFQFENFAFVFVHELPFFCAKTKVLNEARSQHCSVSSDKPGFTVRPDTVKELALPFAV